MPIYIHNKLKTQIHIWYFGRSVFFWSHLFDNMMCVRCTCVHNGFMWPDSTFTFEIFLSMNWFGEISIQTEWVYRQNAAISECYRWKKNHPRSGIIGQLTRFLTLFLDYHRTGAKLFSAACHKYAYKFDRIYWMLCWICYEYILLFYMATLFLTLK